MDAHHRQEDALPRRQFDDETGDPWWPLLFTKLKYDVADPADLVSDGIDQGQANYPREKDLILVGLHAPKSTMRRIAHRGDRAEADNSGSVEPRWIEAEETVSTLPNFELQYPQSVATYDKYEDAQAAVDYLADHEFPVENLMIVGTNLRLVERVLGRRTWLTVIGQGIISGIGSGLLVGVMLALFLGNNTDFLVLVLVGLGLGITMGIFTSVVAYLLSGGKRDFNSMRQTIATSHEVLCEHKLAQKAREMLAEKPGERARSFQ